MVTESLPLIYFSMGPVDTVGLSQGDKVPDH
jgi:hypothetical protein